VLYARQLFGCLGDESRRNLWRFARTVGTSLFVELSTGEGETVPGLVRRLDPEELLSDAIGYGGRLVERSDGPGTGMFDEPDPSVARLHLDFSRERHAQAS
jgi:hypothetical protein